jgi:hypothetical protein
VELGEEGGVVAHDLVGGDDDQVVQLFAQVSAAKKEQ